MSLVSHELAESASKLSWRTSMLVAQNLTIERGDLQLCSQVSFNVTSGQILHVQGPNGIGKTTLLMMLAGLLPASENHLKDGSLDWAGVPISEWPVLYIGHLVGLSAGLSVRENLAFLQGINTNSGANLSLALDMVGLSGYEDVTISRLSSGQKRRVGLARLWLNHDSESLWLLDEPFNALDVGMTRRLSERLAQHVERGGRIILTSHQALTLSVQTLDLGQFALPQDEESVGIESADCEYPH